MKGFITSIAVFLIFSTVFSLVAVFLTKTSEFSDIAIRNSIMDKVFYKFVPIEHALIRIMEEEFKFGGIDIDISENKYNLVTFTETLPRNATNNFKGDVTRFENFTQKYLNETNLFIELNLTVIKDSLPLTIMPYNILYEHKGPGKTELTITPGNNWNLLNSYTFFINVTDGEIEPVSASWSPGVNCRTSSNGNDLKLNITVVDKDEIFGPSVRYVDFDKRCTFAIENETGVNKDNCVRIRHNQQSKEEQRGLIEFEMFKDSCPKVISSVALNLTDMTGKVYVGFPPQAIKVKETLYQIEKNDTIYIFGE